MDLEMMIQRFNKIIESPELFLSYNEAKSTNITSLLKVIYDSSQQQTVGNVSKTSHTLPKLIVENFDTEQIWQQIELQNNHFLRDSMPKISSYVSRKDQLIFTANINNFAEKEQSNITTNHNDDSCNDDNQPQDESRKSANTKKIVPANQDSSDDETDNSNDSVVDNVDIQSESDDSDKDTSGIIQGKHYKKKQSSAVDDDFFNLEEMEDFLDSEDKKEQQQDKLDSDESDSDMNSKTIDYFAAMSDEDGMEENEDADTRRNPQYADFFVKTDESSDIPKNKTKRNKYLKELEEVQMDNLEVENDDVEQSGFDLRQQRLRKKISALENQAISVKPWQLKGEISADSRPENSLLENVLEFDMGSRPAPVITEVTTMLLEDIIRQRIQDRAWDSVQRKEKPIEDIRQSKKQLVMDGEKGKLSLAQIYEKDYLKEQYVEQSEDNDQIETPLHAEIREMITTVLNRLDALSNYHFTPKLAAPEIKILTNLPAISMEEVAPLATSDAALLAPEEVQKRGKGKKGAAPLGAHELTDTDKKRQRKTKKRKQKLHALNATSKSSIPGNKYVKEKAAKMLDLLTKEKNVDKMTNDGLKTVKSSTAFFEQLQDQVNNTIKGKRLMKKVTPSLLAKRLKL